MPDSANKMPAAGPSVPPDEPGAQSMLLLLNQQVESTRAELAQLREKLASVQKALTAERSLQLQEANEKLILAVLHADSIADAAVGSLGELARSAQRDTLTGTPNRAVVFDRLEQAIALAKRKAAQLAVLYVDVDGFKQINDRLGHAVGDAILQTTARRLESVVRLSDTVSRQGGDEFLVLVPEISQASDAELVAEKVLVAFSAPATVGEHHIHVSVSIGIAVYPGHGQDARTLIDRADSAMYRAKKLVGSSFHVFSEDAASGRGRQAGLEILPTRVQEPARADHGAQMQRLREANERLVLGALTALDLQDRAEARHLRQVKFIAMVAHELRNPLNPIRNAAGLLKRVRNDQPLLEKLQGIIERQVVHMARLIDDLLDGSRVGLGKLRLQFATVDILDALGVAVDACRPAIEARHQDFSLNLPRGPLHMEGDHFRLAQIFSNLLDNASKYTPEEGRIRLSLRAEADMYVITVADNGIGITPNALPHVFDLLVQDERALVLQGRGLGIGLAVVRELVTAHGGSVVARSEGEDRGSEFVVSLPVQSSGN